MKLRKKRLEAKSNKQLDIGKLEVYFMRQNILSVVWWILFATVFLGIIRTVGVGIISSMVGFFVLVFVFIPLAVYLAGKTDEYFGHGYFS